MTQCIPETMLRLAIALEQDRACRPSSDPSKRSDGSVVQLGAGEVRPLIHQPRLEDAVEFLEAAHARIALLSFWARLSTFGSGMICATLSTAELLVLRAVCSPYNNPQGRFLPVTHLVDQLGQHRENIASRPISPEYVVSSRDAS
ncbi:hypothetical protein VTK56DRAFT_2070 [Thermocarpiscus australiensis]